MPRLLFTILFILACVSGPPLCVRSAAADGALSHGIAMHGTPSLSADFKHYPYVDPKAAKGGRLKLATTGSFDSVNPLIIKGKSAQGIREFSIESLMSRSLDEPFTLYGLLAEKIEAPEDRASITFHLNPKARFSDDHPVTADDVIFSLELLREKGRPNHRTYYSKVVKAEKLSDLTVRMTFDDSGDREMPLILGLMPILPKHAINPETFEQTTLSPLIGSGPYRVTKVDPGRSITYTRNADYWGRDLGVNRGRSNFDIIKFEYYRDAAVEFEGFKTGDINLRKEEDPATWAEAYAIPAVRRGDIIKSEFETKLPHGMAGLVFNTRRAVFKDQRVRQALIRLFDFEWINKSLYHGLYKRTQSFFERSYLASTGKPADDRERQLLAAFPGAVRSDIASGRYRFPVTDGSGHNRQNARIAFKLLHQAGYRLAGGKLVHEKTGKPLQFEILASSPALERLLANFVKDVSKLGIVASIRVVDSSQYQARLRDYDFDMMQMRWRSSLSPGNEQLFRWSSDIADTPGTFNYAGVRSAAADAMIQAMLAAKTSEDFISAVRALDRVLLSGDYAIPLFHTPKDWVAHWKQLRHPEITPLFGFNIDTWWHKTTD